MSRETFTQAMGVVERYGELLTLGGGEPTCNKHCIEMVEYAAEHYRRGLLEMPPLMITNGKMHGKAHKLLDLIEEGKSFNIELSQDPWHDPIRPDVINRFKVMLEIDWGGTASVGIRSVKQLGPCGRAADPARGLPINPWTPRGSCVCDDLFFTPDGSIYSCGCLHTKIGEVSDPELDLGWYDREFAHQGGRDPA